MLYDDQSYSFNGSNDYFFKYGTRIQIHGRTEMLPPAVQKLIVEVESKTRAHNRYCSELQIEYVCFGS